MTDIALVSVFFNYPSDRKPLIYNNAIKYFNTSDIYIARFEEHDPTVSYYEKLYKFKIGGLLDFLIENIQGKYKYMIFVDATDTNFYKNPSDIIYQFEQFNCDILFCGEKELWPHTNYTHLYSEKQSTGESKYLNSGGYIGYTDKIIENLTIIRDSNYDGRIEDQSSWTIRYLTTNNIIVDSECKIFYSTHLKRNEIDITDPHNPKITTCDPYIIHDNGPHQDDTLKIADLL